MPRGHESKAHPSAQASAHSTTRIEFLAKETMVGGHGEQLGPTIGPTTTFIVTAENMAELAARDPEKARLEIVLKLHKTCSSRVYGFLRKSVPPDIADDLTQETFLKLLQVKNIERKSISISYLFRIAQNLLRRRFNVTKRRREIMEKVAQQETPAQKIRSSEPVGLESIMLDEAFEGLDVHEQETIRLIICDGLSYTQAARALDVPVSTINNWKHRALRKLRGTIDAADSKIQSKHFSPPSDTEIMAEAEASKTRVRKRLQDILRRYQDDPPNVPEEEKTRSESLVEKQAHAACR